MLNLEGDGSRGRILSGGGGATSDSGDLTRENNSCGADELRENEGSDGITPGQTGPRNPYGHSGRRVAQRRQVWGEHRRNARRTICGILPAQKRWCYENQREGGEQTPATPGHSHHLENKCLLGGIWETEAILIPGRGWCSDGCHEGPVDFRDAGSMVEPQPDFMPNPMLQNCRWAR